MSDFPHAFALIARAEGGYVKDPDDPGGETYRGIARVYHPSWPGWRVVDTYKRHVADWYQRPEPFAALDPLVRAFYKAKFWDVFRADEHVEQTISNEIFDQAVNLGVARATRHLQIALSRCNQNQRLWPDVLEDGEYGATTHRTLMIATRQHAKIVPRLYKAMNIAQGWHYLESMRQSSVKEKYAGGWLDRVQILK